MRRIVWTGDALDDLIRIIDYVSDRNAAAAVRLHEAIEHVAGRLPEHPLLYRPGRVPDTREALVNPNYVIVYRVGTDTIEIVAVLHTRQQYP